MSNGWRTMGVRTMKDQSRGRETSKMHNTQPATCQTALTTHLLHTNALHVRDHTSLTSSTENTTRHAPDESFSTSAAAKLSPESQIESALALQLTAFALASRIVSRNCDARPAVAIEGKELDAIDTVIAEQARAGAMTTGSGEPGRSIP